MVTVNAVKQLPHLVCFSHSVVILEIHDLSYPPVRVDPVRSLLALEDKPKCFCELAEPQESEASGIAPRQLKYLCGPHNDIIGDIIEFVNPASLIPNSVLSGAR